MDVEAFDVERPRLLGLAYRMLGTLADAEDVVQEAWIRWSGRPTREVDNPRAWLTTTTTRLALDRLRTARRRREDYVGPWLPEPVALGIDPEVAAELADSLTLGFLVVLDRLTPVERAVFLLADVFDESFADIAVALDRREDYCRQIATRARRKIRDHRPLGVVPATREILAALITALSRGDVDRLLALLDADVTATSDGGRDRRAARRTVAGRVRVAGYLMKLSSRRLTGAAVIEANGAPALQITTDEGLVLVTADERDGAIVAIRMVLNRDKLEHLEQPVRLA
jgi:RNA polymerase sigma-70 factor (ECF subfamily)